MSVGGVIGGCFNALLAPVIFPDVWEYPLALALAAYAADPRWKPADAEGARAWTDDYVNVAGALLAHLRGAR